MNESFKRFLIETPNSQSFILLISVYLPPPEMFISFTNGETKSALHFSIVSNKEATKLEENSTSSSKAKVYSEEDSSKHATR